MSRGARLNPLEKVLAVLVAVMSLLMLAQVISRYVFGKPFSFTEEAARLVFVWAVFLGAVEAFRRGAHVGIDLLFKLFPEKLQRWVSRFNAVVVAGVLILLIVSGIRVVKATSHVDLITIPLPASAVYFAVPFSALVMLLFILWTLASSMRKKNKK